MSHDDILSGKSISRYASGKVRQELRVTGAELWQLAKDKCGSKGAGPLCVL